MFLANLFIFLLLKCLHGVICDFLGVIDHLLGDEFCVGAVFLYEGVVVASFYDLALIKHVYQVCITDGAKAMSDHHYRELIRCNQLIKCFLHHVLTLCVKSTRSLIKQQNFRFSHKCPRNSDPLLLPTRQ